MKNKIFYLCLIALFVNSCQQPSSDLDKIITQCYENTYEEQGYDIRSIIDAYEEVLIEEGVLEDGSGNSYLDVWQRMYSDKDFRITSPSFADFDPFYKVHNETKMAIFQCHNKMIASLKEQDPKWQTVFTDVPTPEIGEAPEQDYQKLYKDMTENMSEADLNSYYFKLIMFMHFDGKNTQFRAQVSSPAVSTDEPAVLN